MIPSDRVSSGRNPDLGTLRDDRYVRCAKCGFICHLDRDRRGQEGSREGDGVDLSSTTFSSLDTHYMWDNSWGRGRWGSTPYAADWSVRIDPVVRAGCSLCGSLLYNKEG